MNRVICKSTITPLFHLTTGLERIAKLLLQNGANANAVENFKNTPLHFAVRGETNEHYAVADLLIQHGANVNAINAQHRTPLDESRFIQSKFSIIIPNRWT